MLEGGERESTLARSKPHATKQNQSRQSHNYPASLVHSIHAPTSNQRRSSIPWPRARARSKTTGRRALDTPPPPAARTHPLSLCRVLDPSLHSRAGELSRRP